MDRLKSHNYLVNYLLVGLTIAFLYGCNFVNDKKYHTEVSITGDKWYFNNTSLEDSQDKIDVLKKYNKPGVVVFEAVVKGGLGEENYRSPKMDIIVQPDK